MADLRQAGPRRCDPGPSLRESELVFGLHESTSMQRDSNCSPRMLLLAVGIQEGPLRTQYFSDLSNFSK